MDTRTRLVTAAAELFFEVGYAASMEQIAQRAGVAKQTLYNHFSSKDALFAEVVQRDSLQMITALGDDTGDLRTRLIRFATTFRDMVQGPRCIALYRTMIAESTRFPDMARAFYASGPERTLSELTLLFETEMRAGRLRGSDAPEIRAQEARFAADMLLSMLTGTERTRFLLGLQVYRADDLAATVVVGRIVDTFLRAFAPSPNHLPPAP
jgi:TetR/AcrR family transcriptional repressor of mexJK operon